MEALKQTFRQYRELFSSMSPSQRVTLLIIPVVVAGSLLFLMYNGETSSYTPLSFGRVFKTEELGNAEQSLLDAGLTDFRRDGQRILVPVKDVDRYNAALLEAGSLTDGWTSEWEKQYEKNVGIFSSPDQMRAMKEIALGKQLEKIIRAIPSIERADVIWSEPNKRKWRGRNDTRTATVSVKPRGGQELPLATVRALRATVAHAVGLPQDKIVVLDQSQGTIHMPQDQDDPFHGGLLELIKKYNGHYRQSIERQLSHISGVNVTVDVKLDNIRSDVERSRTVNPKETVSISSREQSRTRQSNNRPAKTEAGVVPNSAISVDSRAGKEQSEKTEETDSQITVVPSFVDKRTETSGGALKSIQVAVGIPNEYYQSAAAKLVEGQQGLKPGDSEDDEQTKAYNEAIAKEAQTLRDEVPKNVEAVVKQAIGSDPTESTVTVSTIYRTKSEPAPKTPMSATIGSLVSQWGGAVGLALFALWALRMLSKNTSAMPDEPEAGEPDVPPPADSGPAATEPAIDMEPSRRDDLQSVVRDNPEMTAAVIGRWLRDVS